MCNTSQITLVVDTLLRTCKQLWFFAIFDSFFKWSFLHIFIEQELQFLSAETCWFFFGCHPPQTVTVSEPWGAVGPYPPLGLPHLPWPPPACHSPALPEGHTEQGHLASPCPQNGAWCPGLPLAVEMGQARPASSWPADPGGPHRAPGLRWALTHTSALQ